MNIADCVRFIEIADMCDHVPLIRGLHGIGKTQITSQYAKAQGMYYEPLILSLMDTGDMLGIPDTEEVGGLKSTLWAAPSWYTNIVNAAWPEHLKVDRLVFNDQAFQEFVMTNHNGFDHINRANLNQLYCSYYAVPEDRIQLLRQDNVTYADAKRSLLHLDEFNRAEPDILNASLQLILDHRLHVHELPIVNGKETLIVAAVNPANGDYTVQEFDPAMQDRFVIGEAEADLDAWLPWAKENNVNPIVCDFLKDNRNKFHFCPEDGTKGTSPRSWTRLASYIDRLQDNTAEMLVPYIVGAIGSAVAAQFILFYESYNDSLNSAEFIKLMYKAAEEAGEDANVENIAELVMPAVEEMDTVKRQEFAETYLKQFIDAESAEEAAPLLIFLYALPLETLASVLKTLQTEDASGYASLAKLDKEANRKRLFLRIAQYLKR